MKEKGVDLPSAFDPKELCSMNERNKSNAMSNITKAREDWECHMGEKMMIKPYPDELLYQWDQAADRFTAGCRVEAQNFVLNDGNRQPEFSLQAQYMLRHIYFSYNLALDKVGSLWACFYPLIMGRVIPKQFILCTTSIWNNVMSLWPMASKLRPSNSNTKSPR